MNYNLFSESILKFMFDKVPYNSHFRLIILNKLNDIIPCSQSAFIFTNSECTYIDSINLNNEKFQDSFNNLYYTNSIFNKSNIEKFFNIKCEHALSSILTNNMLISNSKYENSKFYKEFLSQENLHYFAVLYFKISDGNFARISLFRTKELGRFSEEDLFLLSSLKHWINIKITEYYHISNERYLQNLLTVGLDHLGIGIICLDSSLNIYFYNNISKNLIDCILINKFKIYKSINHFFYLLFEKINSNNLNSTVPYSFIFENLKIDILKVSIPNFFNKISENYILYLKNIETDNSLSTINGNEKDFFLTKRESEVAKLMFEGLTNKEISINLNISINTVRTHIEKILSKTGTNNRTSAVAKLYR